MLENEGKVDDLQAQYENKLLWSKEKISELYDIISKMEYT